jgi:hypothetical protein
VFADLGATVERAALAARLGAISGTPDAAVKAKILPAS